MDRLGQRHRSDLFLGRETLFKGASGALRQPKRSREDFAAALAIHSIGGFEGRERTGAARREDAGV